MANQLPSIRFNYPLILILGAGALLRIAYWIAAAGEPWFQTPGMDPEYYRSWALAILDGKGSEYIPFPRAPLYPYLLAGMIKVGGDWWLIPRLFNLICDLTTISAIWLLAGRSFGRKAAIIASIFFAVSGMAIYQSGELLMTSLETALAVLFLAASVKSIETSSPYYAGLGGVLAGLFSLCRPNGLLLLPFIPAAILMGGRAPRRTALASGLVGALIGLMTLAPVTCFNYMATGRVIPVATQGGVNFFIGNARSSNGWSSILPGVGADWTDADAARLSQSHAERPLTPFEQSDEFIRMGVEEIRAAPVDWLSLLLRKFLLLVNIREIGNNRPLSLPFEAAPFLRLLFLISFGSLLPLALPGLLHLRRDRPLRLASGGFLVIFGGSLLLFFISSRYRMPLLPAICVLAGIGASRLSIRRTNLFRSRNSIALFLGALIALPPWVGSRFDNAAQGMFVVGNALMKQNKPGEALTFFKRASRFDPDYPRLNLNRGVASMMSGDTLSAITFFDRELDLYPARGEALNNLAVVVEKQGDLPRAKQLFRKSSSLGSGGRDAIDNLMRIFTREGDQFFERSELDSAEFAYRSAVELDPADPRPLFRVALIRATRGDIESARDLARRCLSLSPDYPPAVKLLGELPARE